MDLVSDKHHQLTAILRPVKEETIPNQEAMRSYVHRYYVRKIS